MQLPKLHAIEGLPSALSEVPSEPKMDDLAFLPLSHDVDDDDSVPLEELELRETNEWTAIGETFKVAIWGKDKRPLDELLPLWGLPFLEHIEVSVAEPVAGSDQCWPAPTRSLRRLNLYRSTVANRTVAKLLDISPRLELFRYDHWCDAEGE
jgi:hypothetical protein